MIRRPPRSQRTHTLCPYPPQGAAPGEHPLDARLLLGLGLQHLGNEPDQRLAVLRLLLGPVALRGLLADLQPQDLVLDHPLERSGLRGVLAAVVLLLVVSLVAGQPQKASPYVYARERPNGAVRLVHVLGLARDRADVRSEEHTSE